MNVYRVHATDGDDLGLLEHPAPNLEPGDVVVLADGREAIVTARVETDKVGASRRCLRSQSRRPADERRLDRFVGRDLASHPAGYVRDRSVSGVAPEAKVLLVPKPGDLAFLDRLVEDLLEQRNEQLG